jgi:hypothetical protein
MYEYYTIVRVVYVTHLRGTDRTTMERQLRPLMLDFHTNDLPSDLQSQFRTINIMWLATNYRI